MARVGLCYRRVRQRAARSISPQLWPQEELLRSGGLGVRVGKG